MKRTKIIATLGPASETKEILQKMVEAGMNVARLNFSHGDLAEKEAKIKILRELSTEMKVPIAIVGDLAGPKIRLGNFEGDRQIKKGDIIVLSTEAAGLEVPMDFDLSVYVKVGDRIFLNDGLVELQVKKVNEKKVETEAVNDGWVSAHKGVNIPDTDLGKDAFTLKDREDAIFALKNKVEYLALSFVQRPEDFEEARNLIAEWSPQTKIIAKIERPQAIENLDQIVAAADAVMVARGDLAVETSPAQVPIFQQRIIQTCRQGQKPVIIATEMLASMTDNPRPTRAEASDVANAVMSQVDAVMLSGESARGKYSVETVQTMSNIIVSVEENPDYKRYIKVIWENISPKDMQFNALTSAAASIAYRTNAKLIIVATATGRTARLIASFRPNASIAAVAHEEIVQRQLNLVWGVIPITVPPLLDSEAFWETSEKKILEEKMAGIGDLVVLVGGSANIGTPGATDTIRVTTL